MLSGLLGLQAPDDVWFSRDIHNQVLQHWMLIVKGRKFELVRTPEGDYAFNCGYEPGWTPERERQKPSSRNRGGYWNGYDSWIVLRIGWSNLSKKEIDQCFTAARSYYPPRLSWTQAQDFLRRFADQFVNRYDANWRFFIDNFDIQRQSVPQLPPPPAFLQQQGTTQRQGISMQSVDRLNAMQAGYMRGQQQNMALNNQLMQNGYNPGYGS